MNYEIIKGDNSNYIFSTTHKIIIEIVSKEDKETMKAIERYCEEKKYNTKHNRKRKTRFSFKIRNC